MILSASIRISGLVLAAGLLLLAAPQARLDAATEDLEQDLTRLVPPDEAAPISDPLGDAIVEKTAIALRTEIIQLRNAVQTHPSDPALRIGLANGLIEAGAYGEAEAQARIALSVGGSDDVVAPVLARAMFGEQKFTILVQTIKTGSRPPKAEAQVRALLARAHLALGETRFVEPLIADAQRLDPGGLPATIATTQLLLSRSDFAGAAAEIARARALAPGDLYVLRLLAQIDVLNGDPAGALAACDAILARWPYDIQGLVLRAAFRVDAGDFAGARKDADTLLQAGPNLLIARYIDALLLAKSGDLALAQERLLRVGTDFDALPEGYYLLAIVQTQLGRLDEAMNAAYSFVSRRPSDGRGIRLEAIIALMEKNPARAVSVLRPAVEADSHDGLAATVLAHAYALQHDNDKAFQYYDRAGAATAAGVIAARKGTAKALDAEIQLTLASVDELVRPVLDADSLALVSLISDVKLGAMSSALAKAEALDRRKPGDPIVQDWLGIIQMRRQQYDAAIATFRAAVARDAKFLDAQRNLARAEEAAGKPDLAGKAWNDVLAHAPQDEQANLGLAELALKAGDADKAAEFLEAAQRVGPNDPTPGLNAVNLYAAEKDWAKAISLARVLVSIFPGNVNAFNAEAQVIAESGDLARAEKLYSDFTHAHPDNAAVLSGQAKVLANAGNKPGARASLVRAVAAAPGDFVYMDALVDFDDKSAGHDQALKTARSFAQNDAVASALLSAGILVKADRLKDAIAELKTAFAHHPDTKVAILLAQLLSASGDAASAEALMQSWLGDHPQDWQALIQLGNLYMTRHATEDALAIYLKAASAAPENATVLNNLAWIAAAKSDPRALDWAERAYYLAPSGQSADTYGWLLARGGHAASALPLLQAALAAAPEDPSIQYHAAAALSAAGQKDAAKILLARALASKDQFEGRKDAEALLATLPSD